MLSAFWHRHIFLFGLIALAAGMLFGAVPTSVPQAILIGNWLLEKNFSEKWINLKSNKIFWVLISLFVLHVIGITYTENIANAWKDLWNKVPLLLLPLILFTTKSLDRKEVKLLFNFFFLSVFVSSICCYFVYAGFTKKIILDVRNASVFMSHIRFSLFIAFAIIGLIYFVFKEKQMFFKVANILVVVWLLFFMYKLEMATGFICLIAAGSVLLIWLSIQKMPKLLSVLFISLLIVSWLLILNKAKTSLAMFNPKPNHKANILLEKTANGRYYHHDTQFGIAENGNLVTVNRNLFEVQKEWEQRSKISFSGFDKRGNMINYTILRYLASKGLTKDSLGIARLSNQDIINVENGNSNYLYNVNRGLVNKWREIVWEYIKYKRGENPSGHTLTMRLEFWKTALYIIKQHPVYGVGTGNIQDSFNKAYIKTNSKLDANWRLRCHNQYLAITVAYGIVGLIVFLFYLAYPAIILKKKLHYLYWPFFIIALLSFITEDTLETQAGVTFFAFFNTLFLWLATSVNKSDLNKKAI